VTEQESLTSHPSQADLGRATCLVDGDVQGRLIDDLVLVPGLHHDRIRPDGQTQVRVDERYVLFPVLDTVDVNSHRNDGRVRFRGSQKQHWVEVVGIVERGENFNAITPASASASK
jgi:hypothetical protein